MANTTEPPVTKEELDQNRAFFRQFFEEAEQSLGESLGDTEAIDQLIEAAVEETQQFDAMQLFAFGSALAKAASISMQQQLAAFFNENLTEQVAADSDIVEGTAVETSTIDDDTKHIVAEVLDPDPESKLDD